ncbi:MAG: acyl-CoA thioesterase [Gammaproteobacteria bacterium]
MEARVEWADMDAFKHVNNTVYLRYFERIRMELFMESGFMEYMKKHNIGPILASTQCKFKAPLSYPDSILIGTHITDIEEESFLMQYAIYSEKLNRVAAEGNGLLVYFDYEQGRKTKIPDQLRKHLETFSQQNSRISG